MKKFVLTEMRTEIVYHGRDEHVAIYKNAEDGMFLDYCDLEPFATQEFDTKKDALEALAKKRADIYDSSSSAQKFVIAKEFFVEAIDYENITGMHIIEFAPGIREIADEWIENHCDDEDEDDE